MHTLQIQKNCVTLICLFTNMKFDRPSAGATTEPLNLCVSVVSLLRLNLPLLLRVSDGEDGYRLHALPARCSITGGITRFDPIAGK